MDDFEESPLGWVGETPQGQFRHSFDALIAMLAASLVDVRESDCKLADLYHALRSLRSQYNEPMIAIESQADAPVSSIDLGKLFKMHERSVRRHLSESGLVVSPSTGRGDPMRFDRFKAVEYLRGKLGKEPDYRRTAAKRRV